MDQTSQVQSIQMNASTLCQQAYVPNTSSLWFAAEALSQAEIIRSLERPIINPIPTSAERQVVRLT